MKKSTNVRALQQRYIHRLLSDRSVEDKMPIFVEAKRIFELLKRSTRKRRK